MKGLKLMSCLLILIAGLLSSRMALAEEGHEHGGGEHFNLEKYDQITKKNIGKILSNNVDVDMMISDMKELIEMGETACENHMNEEGTPADEVTIMAIVKENADTIPSLSLAEIESQWHGGGAFVAKGIDVDDIDKLSEGWSHVYIIVHPATVIVYLKEYKKSKNEHLLDEAKGELMELRARLKRLG